MCVSTSIRHHESLGKEQGPCSTGSDTRPSTARATRIILKDFLEFPCHGGGITFIFAAQTGWPGCGRFTMACQARGLVRTVCRQCPPGLCPRIFLLHTGFRFQSRHLRGVEGAPVRPTSPLSSLPTFPHHVLS